MKLAKTIALLGTLLMGAVILYALAVGDFSAEGARLLSMPWGVVSLVDLYMGFVLFSIWIVFREKSFWRSFVWVILMMTLGFFAGSLYMLLALQQSGGDWRKFWLGKRWSPLGG